MLPAALSTQLSNTHHEWCCNSSSLCSSCWLSCCCLDLSICCERVRPHEVAPDGYNLLGGEATAGQVVVHSDVGGVHVDLQEDRTHARHNRNRVRTALLSCAALDAAAANNTWHVLWQSTLIGGWAQHQQDSRRLTASCGTGCHAYDGGMQPPARRSD